MAWRHAVWARGLLLAALLLLAADPLSAQPPVLQEATVSRVMDGDTIELVTGERVRYVGIDSPEVWKRKGSKWVHAPEPFGEAASAINRSLVEGKTVWLEFATEGRDRYGRLLAYVFMGSTLVNAELVKVGLARVHIIPPNVRYSGLLKLLELEAKRENRGLWADVPR